MAATSGAVLRNAIKHLLECTQTRKKMEEQESPVNEYKKGRGAQFNTKNKFQKNERTKEHIESIDDWTETNIATQYLEEHAKGLVNKVDSPDVGMWYSMN